MIYKYIVQYLYHQRWSEGGVALLDDPQVLGILRGERWVVVVDVFYFNLGGGRRHLRFIFPSRLTTDNVTK